MEKKKFHDSFSRLFLASMKIGSIVENRSCKKGNFDGWISLIHIFSQITCSLEILNHSNKGSSIFLSIIIIDLVDTQRFIRRFCSLWKRRIIYIFSNWSTLRLVLPFRTSRNVLYLSRPCLTFSLWILSMVVSPVSSRV